MKKAKDLTIITIIYLLSFIIGYFACMRNENIMYKQFIFDVIATIVCFIFSTILKNSSVYDAYWSLTPMIMMIWLFVYQKAYSPFQIIFLIVFNIWSIRLTLNWVKVFTDFSYEDWRYKKYRDETPKIFWPIVNFFGIHMMPTLVVFLGMLPCYEISTIRIGILSFPGIAIMLMGILFEYFSDIQMHRHLGQNNKNLVCKEGLWKYSRHPNYFGEISFWCGVFMSMLPYALSKWYYGCGFLSIAILFNVVSIPLMEKRQLQRRTDYINYQKETSRLIPRIKRLA